MRFRVMQFHTFGRLQGWVPVGKPYRTYDAALVLLRSFYDGQIIDRSAPRDPCAVMIKGKLYELRPAQPGLPRPSPFSPPPFARTGPVEPSTLRRAPPPLPTGPVRREREKLRAVPR